MGLFTERLRERRRQQHGAATLAVTDLGTPDLGNVELTVRTSTADEQRRNLRQTSVRQRGVTPPVRLVRDPYTITCKQCGKTATRKSHAALYCSILCQNRAHKENEPKREKHHIRCVACNGVIGPDRRPQAKCCSDECARKWGNIRQAERREKERQESRQPTECVNVWKGVMAD